MPHSSEDWGRHRRAAHATPLLSPERERELLLRAQNRDRRAIDELVASHMRLVVSIASRHARCSLSPHDLVAEGAIGLLEAIRRYDCDRDTRFATYAVFWVRACVGRYASANRRIVGPPSTRAGRKARGRLRGVERELAQKLGRWPTRGELAQALEIDEDEICAVDSASTDMSLGLEGGAEPSDEEPCPETLVGDAELRMLRQAQIAHALRALNARESSIVRQHMAEDARSLADMARELGISRQRTGQIMADARAKLRTQLGAVA